MQKSGQQLRRRIRGVRETAKVTHAMEVVAGARMRRVAVRALEARPYSSRLGELIGALLGDVRMQRQHVLLAGHGSPVTLVVHMTTDKGLCGPLNTRLNQSLGRYSLEHSDPVRVVTVGRKGRDFVLRNGIDLVADFSRLGDAPSMAELMPLCRLVIDMFTSGMVGLVYLSYPAFVSTMVQRPALEQLLPVDTTGTRPHARIEFVIDPAADDLLESLLLRFVEAQVYRAYLELVASEYSSRMVAMHNATDSARELGEELTLELNRLRQAVVTAEISDVSGGTEALRTGASHG
ncbi:MAG TPA: ATP synthase F1 subunit gamma [Dehalococcoidia bacterium]|nr:ATP synthase F1 subunit gamma [Dehalococcoidia bacterium]